MKKMCFVLFLLTFGLSLVSCTKPDESDGGYFNVQCDYGTIEENKATILIDGCLPFFDFKTYGIEQLYPGDLLYIEYTGSPVVALSFPGQMCGIEVNSVELRKREIREITEEEIERNELNEISKITNYSYSSEYVIINEELEYVPLSEYTGSTLYASIEQSTSCESSKENSKPGEPKSIPIAAFFAFDPTVKEIYNLNVLNETDYPLVGIKDKYAVNEEVVVKLEYAADVVTFVYLNDEYIGYLSGTDSIKFKMPKKDSTVKISYEYKKPIPDGTYKLNIIDEHDFIINKPKEHDSYFNPNTEIVLYAYPIMDADLAMYVNGEFYSIQKSVLVGEKYLWEYHFIMPNSETLIEFKVQGME